MIPGPWIHKEGIPERPIIKVRISTKAYTKKSYGYLHVHIEITPSTQTNSRIPKERNTYR